MPDDQLQLLALRDDLLPEAKDALTKELQARGLTDLEGFRRTVRENQAITRGADSLTHEKVWRYEQAVVVGLFVLMGWVGAVVLPMELRLSSHPSDARELAFVFCGPLALSSYLGFRARRQGRRLAFFLMVMVPLVLLCGSFVVTLVLT